ncbi:hypothetical protein GOP47_0010930, partial [Adiantum capillus-veneris]
ESDGCSRQPEAMSSGRDGAVVGPRPDDSSSLRARLVARTSSGSSCPLPSTSSRSVSSAFLVAIDQCPGLLMLGPVTRPYHRSTAVLHQKIQVVGCSKATAKKQEKRMTQREISAAAPFSPEVRERERERALA